MRSAPLALLIAASGACATNPASEASNVTPAAATEEVVQCPGPFFGFESGSDRFNPGTARSVAGVVEHMNSPLWRHGWFVLRSHVRNPDDRAAMARVRRREARIIGELTGRGIARDRLKSSRVQIAEETGLEDSVLVISTVPKRIWEQIVPSNMLC